MKNMGALQRWVVLAFVGVQVGCGGVIRDTAKEVTPAVVSGAVEGLAQPDTQRSVLTLTEPKRVEALTHQVSGGVIDGTLDTLEDPARDARIEELSNRLVDGAFATLDTPAHRAQINSLVSGIAGSAVGAIIDQTMSHALDDKTQLKMRLAMRETVGELIGVVFESVRAEMGTPEEREKALGVAAHDITKGATLGFQDAIDQAKHQRADGEKPKDDGSLLIAAGNAPATGTRILWTAALGAGAVVLSLAIALAWAIRKNRSREAELEQRDEALLLLTEAIKSTESQPWSPQLREVLKKSLRDRQGGEHIRRVLREKSGLRLGAQALA